jgi:glucokinase
LALQIGERVGLPVVLENDANCAAWGEARFGAGRDRDDIVMITVGTGIGGGIILDGHLVRGGFGIGAEPGHMNVVRDGLPCGCGQRGCWEQYGSGTALHRRAAELGYQGEGGAHLTAAAHAGDRAALEAFAEVGQWLGRGLASVAALLDPRLIIIGGGVSEAGELILQPVREAFDACLPATSERPHAVIEAAILGGDAGMIGAADLARDLAGA